MNDDLFFAILAMDSYNRGYGAGVKSLGNPTFDQNGNATSVSKIGNATIVRDSSSLKNVDNLRSDLPADFYAIAYDMTGVTGFSGAKKVIAYRGTDNPAQDANTGFGIALGAVDGPQAELAFKFYQAVAGENSDLRSSNIELTGHSLGGGLAGLIGATYQKSAVIFDNMTFENAAKKGFELSDGNPINGESKEIRSLIYKNEQPWTNDIDGMKAIYLKGEFLEDTRALQQTKKYYLDFDQPLDFSWLDSGIFGGNLHSMSLLAIRLYAAYGNDGGPLSTEWQLAAKYFIPKLFDDAVAANIVGISDRKGTAELNEVMRDAIAYSAIDEGERPFGDTGIRAMFNDASDLGSAIKAAGDGSALSALAPEIAKSFVQYAGALAIHDIEANKTPSEGLADSRAIGSLTGILTPETSALSLDYTADTWKFANGGTMPTIAGKAEIISLALAHETGPVTPALAMLHTWPVISFDQFDRVVLSTSDSGSTLSATNSDDVSAAALLAGGAGDDHQTGSIGRDMLLGNGGNDELFGMDGDDILFGGTGSDTLSGGNGNNLLIGGADADTYVIAIDEAGTTTITDDNGTLRIGTLTLGGQFASAAQGSLESGWAKQSESQPEWTLGSYTLTRTGTAGADLTLSGSLQIIVLKDFTEGDYGIRLKPDALNESAVVTTDAGNIRDLLARYEYVTYVNSQPIFSYQTSFLSSAAALPAGGKFIGYVEGDLGNGRTGTIFQAQDIAASGGNISVNSIEFKATAAYAITTGSGNDKIWSNADYTTAQTVNTGDGRDFIKTYGGKGSVHAGAGEDDITLYSLFTGQAQPAPQTEVQGNSGRDTFHGINAASVDGGSGIDRWDFQVRADTDLGYDGDLSGLKAFRNNAVIFDADDGTFAIANTAVAGRFANIETYYVRTGNGNDTITTGSGDDRVEALAGINAVHTGGGNDYVESIGADTIYLGDGDDFVLGAGTDANSGAAFNTSTMTVYGGGGNDTIRAGYGNDVLEGGAGNDVIDGGAGADRVVYSGAWKDYAITGDTFSGFRIGDTRGIDGTDTVTKVENFQFYNGTFAAADIVNAAPLATSDNAAGVTAVNKTVTGNLLTNDSDKNLATANLGETLSLASASSFAQAATQVSGLTTVKGDYGVLAVGLDGSYSYTLGGGRYIANLAPGQTTSDIFSYTAADAHGLKASSYLQVGIEGSVEPPKPEWIEGTAGKDLLQGTAAVDTFLFDNGVRTGRDKITGFGSADILVTTHRIFDSNNDGIVTFGGNRMLDLFGSSIVEIIKDTGGRMTALEYDGMVMRDDVSYYVYSAIGSPAGMADLIL